MKVKTALIFLWLLVFESYSQNVELTTIKELVLFGNFEVRLEKAADCSVVFDAGKDYSNLVSISQKDSILTIKLLQSISPDPQIKLSVYYKNLRQISASAGVKVYNKGILDGIKELKASSGADIDLKIISDSLSLIVNRGGFIRMVGNAPVLNAKTGFGGVLRLAEFKIAKGCFVMNGGDAEVDVKEKICAKIRYGASLKYVAMPKEIDKHTFINGEFKELDGF